MAISENKKQFIDSHLVEDGIEARLDRSWSACMRASILYLRQKDNTDYDFIFWLGLKSPVLKHVIRKR